MDEDNNGLTAQEKERRAYNRHLRTLNKARSTASVDEFENLLIEFDEKWCPEVVEKRKSKGLYKKWAGQKNEALW